MSLLDCVVNPGAVCCIQVLMLVELCVVVRVCGVLLWIVFVRCVVFDVGCRCALLVDVANC